jgi:predicted RNA-binding protein with PUA-like domain
MPDGWLMKSEPDVFSFTDLWKAKGRRTLWDGVRNYRARNFMRDQMKVGDPVFYYHSNAEPPGIAGVAEVASETYPDPSQFDPKSKYFDPKSDPEAPRWWLVDIKAVKKLPQFVSLAELKANPKLEGMGVVQRGNRLSIQPVAGAEWDEVLLMGGL